MRHGFFSNRLRFVCLFRVFASYIYFVLVFRLLNSTYEEHGRSGQAFSRVLSFVHLSARSIRAKWLFEVCGRNGWAKCTSERTIRDGQAKWAYEMGVRNK